MESSTNIDAGADNEIPSNIAINLPSIETIERVAIKMEKTVSAIKITTPAMYELAAQELQDIQGKLADLNEKRMAITRPMDAAKKAVMSLFAPSVARCEAAIEVLKKGMLAWNQAERLRKAEEQRVIDEAARQERIKANQVLIDQQAAVEAKNRELAETRRKAVEAEQRALKAVVDGDAEAEREASRIAVELQQEEARLQSDADDAARRARATEQSAAVIAAPKTAASSAPKGISTAAPWVAELIDDTPENMMLLIRHIAEHPEHVNFVTVNIAPITALAKALRENCKIPGIRAHQRESIRSRRS